MTQPTSPVPPLEGGGNPNEDGIPELETHSSDQGRPESKPQGTLEDQKTNMDAEGPATAPEPEDLTPTADDDEERARQEPDIPQNRPQDPLRYPQTEDDGGQPTPGR